MSCRTESSSDRGPFDLVGYHVSSAGGLVEAWERIEELGCKVVQVFSSPPRRWVLPRIDDEALNNFVSRVASSGGRVVLHAPYLVNLAAESTEIRKKSIDAVSYGLDLCSAVGGSGLVVHAGTATDGDRKRALRRLRGAVRSLARRRPRARLVFELTAGGGTAIASVPADVPVLLSVSDPLGDVSICLDTQHLWAAGYDWTGRGLPQLLEDIHVLVGWERLVCLHINDSKSALGSRVDRHANIGSGVIGLQPFVDLLVHSQLRDVIKVLETPGDVATRKSELRALKTCVTSALKRSAPPKLRRAGRVGRS